jgi:hypothetical protein
MEFVILLCFIPVAIAFGSKLLWPRDITFAEMGGVFAIGSIIPIIVYALGMASQTADREVINGQVVNKAREQVSCEHSYQCHCHPVRSCSGSGKNRSCSTTTQCDTCYEHSFDISWRVYSNINETYSISRIDRQGLGQPPRWTQVNAGDPVSTTQSFTNYVKAVPESLFHANLTHKHDTMIPPYPLNIYDYYKIDRAISVGVQVPDLKQWDVDISNILRTLGPSKQANVIVLFVNTADESYLHALEGKWIGGKKNDIIVIIGTTQYPKIDWVAVSSWTDKALFKVQLRDDIFALQNIDREKIIQAIQVNTAKTFERKHMKDFEYLKYKIEPPDWVLTLAIVLSIVASLIASYVFSKNDVRC